MAPNVKNYTEQGGDKTVIGGELEIKEGARVSGLPSPTITPAAYQPESEATNLALLRADFNTLLANLKAAGFVDREAALAVGLNGFAFPLIVKPVDSSGSKGVTVIRNPADYPAAVDFAFSFSRGKRIVVEEFIEKRHPYLIGGDIFVSDGKVIQWGPTSPLHSDSYSLEKEASL